MTFSVKSLLRLAQGTLIVLALSRSAQAAESTSQKLDEETPPVWQNSDTQFFNQYPHLKDNVYKEPESHLHLGISGGLIGFVANRIFFSANFFQVHYITENWDNELFSTAYGSTTTQPSNVKSDHFIFRTVPKYRFNKYVSLGPLLGYEYISFPNISAVQVQNGKSTRSEPFSTYGTIYGVSAAETFSLEGGSLLRITEIVYQETYSVTSAGGGWTYQYNVPALNTSQSTIAPGVVTSIEIGILF